MLKTFHVCFKKFFFRLTGSNDHHWPQNMAVLTFLNKARWYKEYIQNILFSPVFFHFFLYVVFLNVNKVPYYDRWSKKCWAFWVPICVILNKFLFHPYNSIMLLGYLKSANYKTHKKKKKNIKLCLENFKWPVEVSHSIQETMFDLRLEYFLFSTRR